MKKEIILPPCLAYGDRLCMPTCPNYSAALEVFLMELQIYKQYSPEQVLAWTAESEEISHVRRGIVSQVNVPDQIICTCPNETKM